MHRLSLADLWTVYRLQRSGIRLDVRGAVVEPDPPLYLAVRNELLRWRQQVKTVVLRRGDRQQAGFVQLHRRSSQPAMDIVFIAPSLDQGAGVAWLWKNLLSDAVKVAGMSNAQRVYAHLPASRHAEVEVLRQAGFALYAQDQLYRMNPPARWPAQPDRLTWQPQTQVDEWGLTKLYHAITPAVVQQAETIGSTTDGQNGSSNTIHSWGENRKGCYVIHNEENIRGYLRLTQGKRGHWLKMVLHPEISDQGEQLLHEALSLMHDWPKQPVFSDVRQYEGYLTDALDRCGFRHVMTRRLLVHHTTVRVPAVEPKWAKLMEQAQTRAPTVTSNQIQQYEVKPNRGKANNYG